RRTVGSPLPKQFFLKFRFLILIPKSAIRNPKSHRFSGDFVGRVTPVPIPNTEVKPAGADGTARETVWESRKSPGLLNKSPLNKCSGGFFVAFLRAAGVPNGIGACRGT